MIIGELKYAYQVGRKGQAKLIWASCIDCGKERWVQVKKEKPESQRCNSCAGKLRNKCRTYMPRYGSDSPGWKGGRYKTKQGYILLRISRDSPFYSMANSDGYVFEHRVMVAQNLNRCLLNTETVHHKNGVRDDNRPENLELISPSNHSLRSQLCSHCELRNEIRLLRWQLKELTKQMQGGLL